MKIILIIFKVQPIISESRTGLIKRSPWWLGITLGLIFAMIEGQNTLAQAPIPVPELPPDSHPSDPKPDSTLPTSSDTFEIIPVNTRVTPINSNNTTNNNNVNNESNSSPFMLKKGDQGSIVRELQRQLFEGGFYQGDIDGIFGTQTEIAVRQFQNKQGLEEDGIVGMNTLRALTQNLSENNLAVSNTNNTSTQDLTQNNLAVSIPNNTFNQNSTQNNLAVSSPNNTLTQNLTQNNLAVSSPNNTLPQNLTQNNSSSYIVIVPIQDSDTLTKVKQIAPDAFIRNSYRGDYVQAGVFSSREAAESQSAHLRTLELDARVFYP